MLVRTLLSLLLLCFACAATGQETAPDVLVKSITQDVLASLKQESGNPKRVTELVETKVLPHFNFARMTQLALAVNWRRATPEQQSALTQEFRTLLVRTYSTALSSYRDQAVDFKPLRARPGDTEITVRTEIRQRGAQPLGIDYDMEKTPSGWKVFDVKIGGVSLITTYKDDFANQIREAGVDGLIKSLSTKNRQTSDIRAKSS